MEISKGFVSFNIILADSIGPCVAIKVAIVLSLKVFVSWPSAL